MYMYPIESGGTAVYLGVQLCSSRSSTRRVLNLVLRVLRTKLSGSGARVRPYLSTVYPDLGVLEYRVLSYPDLGPGYFSSCRRARKVSATDWTGVHSCVLVLEYCAVDI